LERPSRTLILENLKATRLRVLAQTLGLTDLGKTRQSLLERLLQFRGFTTDQLLQQLTLDELRDVAARAIGQLDLRSRLRLGHASYVFLDPDGTLESALHLVIEHPTGIIYGTQCGGTACEERATEGYLVPLGGHMFDVDRGRLDLAEFTAVFHKGTACLNWTGTELPRERLSRLRALVEQVVYWKVEPDLESDTRGHLRLDDSRIGEVAEGWIPVLSDEGRGILLHDNCD